MQIRFANIVRPIESGKCSTVARLIPQLTDLDFPSISTEANMRKDKYSSPKSVVVPCSRSLITLWLQSMTLSLLRSSM